MKFTQVKSDDFKESYFKAVHPSGLNIFVYPKENFNSTYAIFGTKFGSINNHFKLANGKVVKVPDGVAHFLEHKLFESEDGDAFTKYAKTGASANAFTGFDNTCYLFGCTQNFKKSLQILLDLVRSPYFTEETVNKEQGIIAQEIKMYDDDPDWRVKFNLFKALFHNHPVKIDVGGTVESIGKITPDVLYTCYNAYYNLKNMGLCIAGKVDVKEVEDVVNEIIKPQEPEEEGLPLNIFEEEPYCVANSFVSQTFPISIKMFELGFKEESTGKLPQKEIILSQMLLYILASKTSPLYQTLVEKELINESFGTSYFQGEGYAACIFSGESSDPKTVEELIKKEITNLKENGFSKEDFERAKKVFYAKMFASFDSIEGISTLFLNLHFVEEEFFKLLEEVKNITKEDLEQRLHQVLDINNSALSVVTPK